MTGMDALRNENKVLKDENTLLREQVNLLTSKLYGRKSEKAGVLADSDEIQDPLFDLDDAEVEDGDEDANQEEPAPSRPRKRGKRKPIPDHFPRIEVVHDTPEDERTCDCGATLEPCGEETSEQVNWIPARVEVIRHIRIKRACRSCEGVESAGPTVVIPPPAPTMIPKSLAAPGLLATVLVNKFVDALPFYRQEKIFARSGLKLGRTTMSNWCCKAADRCRDLIDMLREDVVAHDFIQMDETTIQVLNEDGRANRTKSYVWVARGGPPDGRVLYFHYHPTRRSTFARELLDGYSGAVQTDGYVGYDFLDKVEGVTHLACWVHVRRKFTESVKGSKTRRKRGSSGKKAHADKALDMIGDLYKVEDKADDLGLIGEDRVAYRHQHAKPVLDAFKAWLDDLSPRTLPGSLLGKAVAYSLTLWPRLIAYLDIPEATPDNNLIENGIRPVVLGRKNWLFAGSPQGAAASAGFYSLLETAKANGWEPYVYLRFLFEHLPFADTLADQRLLLPHVAKPISIDDFLGGQG